MAKESYSNNLRHGRWQERRLRIMERDGFCCTICGSKDKLQVHHRVYISGRKVYQYDSKDLTTLCDACHFRVHLNKPIPKPEFSETEEPIKLTTIQRLQKKLSEPLGEDLQMDILKHIVFLQKGGVYGRR